MYINSFGKRYSELQIDCGASRSPSAATNPARFPYTPPSPPVYLYLPFFNQLSDWEPFVSVFLADLHADYTLEYEIISGVVFFFCTYLFFFYTIFQVAELDMHTNLSATFLRIYHSSPKNKLTDYTKHLNWPTSWDYSAINFLSLTKGFQKK